MKFVTNLDWSTDSRFLQSVDGDFELHNCKLTKHSSSVWMKTFLNNFPALQCITLNTNFLKTILQGIYSAWKEKMPGPFETVIGRRIAVALAIHWWVWILRFFSLSVKQILSGKSSSNTFSPPPPIHCYWSVFYGCSVGPWTSCDAGETVSVVARSNYREIIITGDNTGRMKVFKYPSSTNMVTYDFRVFNLYTFKISPFGFWA